MHITIISGSDPSQQDSKQSCIAIDAQKHQVDFSMRPTSLLITFAVFACSIPPSYEMAVSGSREKIALRSANQPFQALHEHNTGEYSGAGSHGHGSGGHGRGHDKHHGGDDGNGGYSNGQGGNGGGGDGAGNHEPNDPACPSTLYFNPQCCAVGVLGLADLNCKNGSSHLTFAAFDAPND